MQAMLHSLLANLSVSLAHQLKRCVKPSSGVVFVSGPNNSLYDVVSAKAALTLIPASFYCYLGCLYAMRNISRPSDLSKYACSLDPPVAVLSPFRHTEVFVCCGHCVCKSKACKKADKTRLQACYQHWAHDVRKNTWIWF